MVGSVSKVEMATPMALIYKMLFPCYIHVGNTTSKACSLAMMAAQLVENT
jgi:hypothetical protein